MVVVFLSGPLDIVGCLHNAFRRDIFQIDDDAFKIARGGGDLTLVFDRLRVMGEVLDYHARGEEAAVFPAVDNVAPLGGESLTLWITVNLTSWLLGWKHIRKMPDSLSAARATAALNAHLRIHLNKEDAHLYPILRERTSESEQASIVGAMAGKVPPEKFHELTHWLFPLLDFDDQLMITRGWMALMPPPVFANVKPLIKQNTAENWVKLTQQIPELNEK